MRKSNFKFSYDVISVTSSPLRHRKTSQKFFRFGPLSIKISGCDSGLGLIIWWSLKKVVLVLKKWSWSWSVSLGLEKIGIYDQITHNRMQWHSVFSRSARQLELEQYSTQQHHYIHLFRLILVVNSWKIITTKKEPPILQTIIRPGSTKEHMFSSQDASW